MADVLTGFDVEGGFVGGVAGKERVSWVQVEFYSGELRILSRDLGVEEGWDGCMWEQPSANCQQLSAQVPRPHVPVCAIT